MNTKISFIVLASIFSIVSLLSCKKIQDRNLNADVAKLGVVITDKFIADSRTIGQLEQYFKFNGEYVDILNSAKKDSLARIDSARNNSASLVASMIALNKVYQSYFLFADKGILPEDTKFSENVKAVTEVLKTIMPDETKQLSTIEKAVYSRRFDEKAVMFYLNSLFLKYLEKEFAAQKVAIQNMLNNYEKQVKRIPETAFDPKKLAEKVKEPVNGDKLLIEVYKLSMISEAADKTAEMIQALEKAEDAMKLLNRMHGEFLKKKPDSDEIQNMLIRAQNIYSISDREE